MPKEEQNKVSKKNRSSLAKHSVRSQNSQDVVLENYKRLEHEFIALARQNSKPAASNPFSLWNYLPPNLMETPEGESKLNLFITECLAEVHRLRANSEADQEELDDLKAETRALISQMLAA